MSVNNYILIFVCLIMHLGEFYSTFYFPPQEVPSGQPDSDAVGRPLTHLSALKQTTGEAVYIDDIPHIDGSIIHICKCIHMLIDSC